MTEKSTKPKAKAAKSTKPKAKAAKSTKPKAKAAKSTKPKAKAAKSTKPKAKPKDGALDDIGIVIVDDDIIIDKERVNEERRAYLEEARSQEAFD